jgi:antitoxin component of MazEF toxin-antitoxin module
MRTQQLDMTTLTEDLPTKAEKIRALGRAGYNRADIARFLDIRYQHVRNTLEAAGIPMPDRGADTDPRNHSGQLRTAVRDAKAPLKVTGSDGYYPLYVAPEGGLVIPRALLDEMMLDPDGRVTARVKDGELHIISPMAAIRRAQRIAKELDRGEGSVVDELIAERRAEAARENEKA